MNKTSIFINACLPVLVGGGIYFLWKYYNLFSEGELYVLRCYVPDMLWAYAFSFIMLLINKDGSFFPAMPVSFIFIFINEIIQLSPGARGTFDIMDIVLEIFSAVISFLIFKKLKKERN